MQIYFIISDESHGNWIKTSTLILSKSNSFQTMSLKILKQQLKDIREEDEVVMPVPRKERKKASLPEAKFTRQRKVMKKNIKPRGPVQMIEDEVSRVKEGMSGLVCLCIEVKYAKERKELNRERNLNFIEAVSRVDGESIMNRV